MPLAMQTEEPKKIKNIRNGRGAADVYEVKLSPGNGHTGFTARIELELGASIGYHTHEKDEETYAIVSGEGIYRYDGGFCRALPGDIFVTQIGSGHALENTGNEPLVFFAIISE